MITLSFSACQKFLLSPRSWYLHYLMRLRPIEQGSALAFGSAVDDALNVLLAPPLNREPEALAKAKDTFEEKWYLSKYENIKYSKADLDESMLGGVEEGVNRSWASLREKGLYILEAYAEQIVPRIKEVLAVQKEINLKNEAGDAFTGIIDLIVVWEDDRVILFDNKTSSVKYPADAVEISGQLGTYVEAVKEEYKITNAGYIIIPKQIRKKKKPLVPIEVMIGNITENLIEKTFQDYERVLSGIKTGQFECTRSQREGCCSKPWGCAYKNYCESGGTDMTGLKVEEKRK